MTKWRKRRDSNPRYPFRYPSFQDWSHQPLGHSSSLKFSMRRARSAKDQYFALKSHSRPNAFAPNAVVVAAPQLRLCSNSSGRSVVADAQNSLHMFDAYEFHHYACQQKCSRILEVPGIDEARLNKQDVPRGIEI